MTINRPETFKLIRKEFGPLSQKQVDSLNLFFDEWDGKDKRHLCYILATAYHEVGPELQPIEEIGKGKGKAYGVKVKGRIYYGRGYCQVTWIRNYQKLTLACKGKWDFEHNPELLLQPEPAIWATFYGMKTGLYTGVKLSDFFNSTKSDPVRARRIINGNDCAAKIARHYYSFYKCIV